MALMNYQELGSATNAAGQVLMTARGNLSDPCATVASTVYRRIANLDVDQVYLHGDDYRCGRHASYLRAYYSNRRISIHLHRGGRGTGKQGEPATVSVSYQYTWIPAYLLKLAGNLAASSTVLV